MDYKTYGIAMRYSEQLTTQMRKGTLAYLVLIVAQKEIHTSDIIRHFASAGLTVVEGTIYPLLARLVRDGLIEAKWRQDDPAKPPRKYYFTTNLGREVVKQLDTETTRLNKAIKSLKKEAR